MSEHTRNDLLEQILAALNGGNPSTIGIERILEAQSTAASQEPTGLGQANAAQIEFGPAQSLPGVVDIDVNGVLTFSETGLYRLKVALQFQRTSNTGTSELLFRAVANGTQLGRSAHYSLRNQNTSQYFESDSWLEIPAGTVFTFEVMRDASGDDSGGLFLFQPSAEPDSWEDSPSAYISVERLRALP